MTERPSPSRAGDAVESGRHPLAVSVCVVLAGALVVLDQATKHLAEALLDRGQFVPLIGDHVGWQLVYNPGVAFGIPAPIWLPLSVTVIVVVIVARALPRTQRLLPAVSYGFLLAGATGNVIDRLFRTGTGQGFGSGEVVDFVAWGTFPRFNVADSAITIGFLLLIVALWHEERASEPATADEPTSPADAGPDSDSSIAPVDEHSTSGPDDGEAEDDATSGRRS